jgi:hypothetical protein
MSKQALKRVRKAIGLPVNREELPAFAWPGGYPILYIFADGGTCCPKCANANIDQIAAEGRNSHGGWALGGFYLHMKGEPDACDHCNAEMESAYGPVDATA